jgi:hypothetical protein
MNKFLEDAAMAVRKEHNERSGVAMTCFENWENGEIRDEADIYVQAVFDSAKILLLPAGAEPMIGDVGVNHINHLCIYTEVSGWELINKKAVEVGFLPASPKIIAREGYNSVLQES